MNLYQASIYQRISHDFPRFSSDLQVLMNSNGAMAWRTVTFVAAQQPVARTPTHWATAWRRPDGWAIIALQAYFVRVYVFVLYVYMCNICVYELYMYVCTYVCACMYVCMSVCNVHMHVMQCNAMQCYVMQRNVMYCSAMQCNVI